MSVAVGLVGTDQPMASATIETERRHAEEIAPLIQTLVAEAGVKLAELDVLVVDRGPGRFTGLRVGLATVRTLAFALDVPVVGLTSLEILASVGSVVDHEWYADAGETVTSVIDARRNEVFQQSFKAGRPIGDEMVGLAEELAGRAVGVVVGDGLDRYHETYQSVAGVEPNASVAMGGVTVDARTMLKLAGGVDPRPGAEIEPLYLRNPDVNPNVKTRPRV
jgi:tRNA threonylcarbamoyladenosine biosynthesis protein TsaB